MASTNSLDWLQRCKNTKVNQQFYENSILKLKYKLRIFAYIYYILIQSVRGGGNDYLNKIMS